MLTYQMEMMAFHNGRPSVFASETLQVPKITLDHIVGGSRYTVEASQPRKDTDETLDLGNVDMEAGKQLGDKKNYRQIWGP